MTASMWEVTGLVLGAPGDAAAIAQAHGFTPAEVADLLPLYLDNASVDWSAVDTMPALTPVSGDAAQWLADLGGQLRGILDVTSYDGFATPGLDVLDPGLDTFDDLPGTSHVPPAATEPPLVPDDLGAAHAFGAGATLPADPGGPGADLGPGLGHDGGIGADLDSELRGLGAAHPEGDGPVEPDVHSDLDDLPGRHAHQSAADGADHPHGTGADLGDPDDHGFGFD